MTEIVVWNFEIRDTWFFDKFLERPSSCIRLWIQFENGRQKLFEAFYWVEGVCEVDKRLYISPPLTTTQSSSVLSNKFLCFRQHVESLSFEVWTLLKAEHAWLFHDKSSHKGPVCITKATKSSLGTLGTFLDKKSLACIWIKSRYAVHSAAFVGNTANYSML